MLPQWKGLKHSWNIRIVFIAFKNALRNFYGRSYVACINGHALPLSCFNFTRTGNENEHSLASCKRAEGGTWQRKKGKISNLFWRQFQLAQFKVTLIESLSFWTPRRKFLHGVKPSQEKRKEIFSPLCELPSEVATLLIRFRSFSLGDLAGRSRHEET